MRALCWHGKGDVRVDTVPDPKIEHPAMRSSRSPPARSAAPTCTCSTAISRRWKAATSSAMRTWARSSLARGHQPQDRRQGGGALHDQLRPVLVLPARHVLGV